MKLVAFSHKGEAQVRRGAVIGENKMVEVTGSFNDLGEEALSKLRQVINQPDGHQAVLDLSQVKLHSPLPNPGKILCIGLNYLDHCLETGLPIPKQPILFAKFNNTLIGQEGEIRLDGTSQEVDYEAELAFVIGKRAWHVSEAEAMEYVAGYVTANDVSGRDLQFAETQWVRGKSQDTFCPLGPWVVTKDEIPDPHELGIRCRVNGQTLQDSNTRQLIFKIPALIAHLSHGMTLEPGDVVLTGTPPGVGMARNPKIYLKPGDTVEIEIDGVGLLKNTVVDAGYSKSRES